MTGIQIADITIGLTICILLFVLFAFTLKKKTIWLILTLEMAGIFVSYILGMPFSEIMLSCLFVVTLFVVYFVNIGEVREYVANPLKQSASVGFHQASKDFDRARFAKTITQAVKWLSDNRTGAIITFERNTNLDRYIESGTIINAPVTAELIETIFYEGTRLHDGAIVIRGSTIIAASVFFPSTDRTLVGKYGARHRAALGISEVTDSVTIVVSEETGRISVAFSGMLESIKYDEFEKVFQTFMIAPSKADGK